MIRTSIKMGLIIHQLKDETMNIGFNFEEL